jgi:hypothetical protein
VLVSRVERAQVNKKKKSSCWKERKRTERRTKVGKEERKEEKEEEEREKISKHGHVRLIPLYALYWKRIYIGRKRCTHDSIRIRTAQK